MTAENEALAMLAHAYEAKAGLVERQITILEDVQRVGIENVAPDVPVIVKTIRAKIDELDVLISEARQLLGIEVAEPPPVTATKH
jgi:hypothetical protein